MSICMYVCLVCLSENPLPDWLLTSGPMANCLYWMVFFLEIINDLWSTFFVGDRGSCKPAYHATTFVFVLVILTAHIGRFSVSQMRVLCKETSNDYSSNLYASGKWKEIIKGGLRAYTLIFFYFYFLLI